MSFALGAGDDRGEGGGLGGSAGGASDDREVFAGLYPSLRRFARVVGPREVDADDLVQEALVRTLRGHALSDLADPGAYLRRTITNLASNARRDLGRRRRAFGRLIERDETTPVGYPSDLDDLMRLRPLERAAVYLFAVEGQSHEQVAATLGCSVSAARTRVSRALRRLRAELSEEAHGA